MERGLARHKRKLRIRRRLIGTPERPRLAVFKSLKHLYAQIVDDVGAKTLVAVSTLDKEWREERKKGHGLKGNMAGAQRMGELLARRAKLKGIQKVAFDRSGFKYHGVLKALAEKAKEGGLVF